MLCLDISHKVVRSDTVLDFLYELRRKYPESEYFAAARRELIGEIVLTRSGSPFLRC